MPIGYLITSGWVAAVAVAAVSGRRPRRSSPFRLSYSIGVLLNWPLVAFLVLAVSTALAIDQSGTGSAVFRVGLGFAVSAAVGLTILCLRARETGPVLERALDDGLGADWRDHVDAELHARLRRRPSLGRVLAAPLSSRRRGVERISNVRYGPSSRANLLDVYRGRSGRRGRPTLVHLHPLFGSKRLGTRHLFHRLAADGWVCVSANYRRPANGFSDPLSDVQKVIGWVREHGPEYGADPGTVFLAGSSLGGHLASLAALAHDAPVAGVISLYGYYGPVARGGSPSSRLSYSTTNAPPWFVVHGEDDTLVIVEDARGVVEQLRATSSNPVVYAELPGGQHGFDLFRSRRFDSVVDAIEAFAAYVRSRPRTGRRRGG